MDLVALGVGVGWTDVCYAPAQGCIGGKKGRSEGRGMF